MGSRGPAPRPVGRSVVVLIAVNGVVAAGCGHPAPHRMPADRGLRALSGRSFRQEAQPPRLGPLG
jgi:hypothetical protein